jgi:hypothetical protein
MAKFRKKPVVIEAEQFFNPKMSAFGHVPDGVKWRDVQRGDDSDTVWAGGMYYIETLEGPLRVSDGDWIITGVKGEKYPCKPDIFEATYEPVDVAGAKEITSKRGLHGPQDDCG